MNIQIHFHHVPHSPHLAEQLTGWLSDHFSSFVDTRPFHVNLFISNLSHRLPAHGALFEVHLIARAPFLGKEIFAKVSDQDMWQAFTACANCLRKQMLKDLCTRRARRRFAGGWRQEAI